MSQPWGRGDPTTASLLCSPEGPCPGCAAGCHGNSMGGDDAGRPGQRKGWDRKETQVIWRQSKALRGEARTRETGRPGRSWLPGRAPGRHVPPPGPGLDRAARRGLRACGMLQAATCSACRAERPAATAVTPAWRATAWLGAGGQLGRGLARGHGPGGCEGMWRSLLSLFRAWSHGLGRVRGHGCEQPTPPNCPG